MGFWFVSGLYIQTYRVSAYAALLRVKLPKSYLISFTRKLISLVLLFIRQGTRWCLYFSGKLLIYMCKQNQRGIIACFLDEYAQQVVGKFRKTSIFKRLITWHNPYISGKFRFAIAVGVSYDWTSICLKLKRKKVKVGMICPDSCPASNMLSFIRQFICLMQAQEHFGW